MTTATTVPATTADVDRALLCLVLDDLAARTSTVLQAAGIDHLLIKGQVTARLLHPGRPDRRFHSDVDLLVRPDRFDAAQAALAAAGYRSSSIGLRRGELSWEERVWLDPDQHLFHVDLHRGFHGVTRPVEFFDALWADRSSIRLCGRFLPTPDRVGATLMVLLHAAGPGSSAKPAADLRRAADRLDAETLAAAVDLAQRCGAGAACAAVLRALDAQPAGPGAALRPSAVEWMWLRGCPPTSVALARLLCRPGIRGKFGFGLTRLVPSPTALRLADARRRRRPGGWRVARSGDAPPRTGVGLVGAYARRLASTLRGLPRALRDVRAAARAGARFQPSSEPVPAPEERRTPPVPAGDRWRAGVWAARAWRRTRRDLRTTPLERLRVPAPPVAADGARRSVVLTLALLRASCLERSLVLQRWDAGAGLTRDVVIGVACAGADTRAHAWLDGENPRDDFRPIHRHHPPADPDAKR